jgi:hypothetical protein
MAPTSRRRPCTALPCLGIVNFLASNGQFGRFKRRCNIVYINLSGESRSVDPETVEDWKNYRLLQEI